MGNHVVKFAGRQVVVTGASKDSALSLSAALHRLEDIANHAHVKSIYRDGYESECERWAMYGKGETPPRDPEEFARKRTALFNSIPPSIKRNQLPYFVGKAKEIFEAHVAQVVEDHRKPAPPVAAAGTQPAG